ncbi:uncharacterized protein LOC144744125 [Ciona intestinalis]
MTSCKAPLQVLENSDNTKLHEYGKPILKSLKPCTVQKTGCNQKWISPDKHLTNELHQQDSKKSTKSNKLKNQKSAENSKPNRDKTPTVNCSVKNTQTKVDDDDKENVPPGGRRSYRNKTLQAANKSSEKLRRPQIKTLKEQQSPNRLR